MNSMNNKDEPIVKSSYPDLKDRIVLIAEDEETSYLLLDEILKEHGIVTIHAKNGKEAMSLVMQHPEIELILMDVLMPHVDGLTASKEIKKNFPTIKIIIQTAYPCQKGSIKEMLAFCDSYIEKPISQEKLIRTISKHLS